jgi:hypothetical protein
MTLPRTRVTLRSNKPYFSWNEATVLPGDPPHEFYGEYTRLGDRGSWMRHVTTEVYMGGSVEDFIHAIQFAALGLKETSVESPSGHDEYDYPYLAVTGVREALPEELVWVERQIKVEEEAASQQRAKEVETLKIRLAELEGS